MIIPIAPYHQDVSATAIAAMEAQTVPVVPFVLYDDSGHGPAYVRNYGLERVETPFIIFLDADDAIEPTFCADCLNVWRPDRYVFSDWYEGATSKVAPDCPWSNKSWHPITTLIPTDWARRVGGFDESLPAAEDTDFYMKLATGGCCGIHLHKPLFHYGADGQRSRQFVKSLDYTRVMDLFTERYGSKHMGCCGDNMPVDLPIADGLPGDIIVQAAWQGNQHKRGMITGRLYERTSYPKQLRVDPRDAHAQPHLFRIQQTQTLPRVMPMRPAPLIVEPEAPPTRLLDGVKQVAEALWGQPVPLSLDEMEQLAPAKVNPNVAKIRQLAQGKGT